MKTVSLGEWGRKLPVGFVDGEKFNREFSFRDLDFGIEREIQKARSKERVSTIGGIASNVLSKLLVTLGGEKVDPEKPEETKARLAGCWLADIMYMWLWARRESCGKDIQLPFPCQNPRCMYVDKDPMPNYDLDSFDINVAESSADLRGMWTTKFPYEIRSQVVNAFKLQPSRWSTYLVAEAEEISAQMLIAGICGTDKHESIILIDQEINRLKRPDYMGIQEEIGKLSLGPKMVVEHVCPKCKSEDKMFLDWGYDSFFS